MTDYSCTSCEWAHQCPVYENEGVMQDCIEHSAQSYDEANDPIADAIDAFYLR